MIVILIVFANHGAEKVDRATANIAADYVQAERACGAQRRRRRLSGSNVSANLVNF
jgi:hypothetical protein